MLPLGHFGVLIGSEQYECDIRQYWILGILSESGIS